MADTLTIEPGLPQFHIRICEECWMPYGWTPHDGGRKPKYCSAACRKIVMRRQQQGHKTIPKNCVACGQVFFTDKWKAHTKKFCSNTCSWKHNSKFGGSVPVPCSVCGKTVKRNPSNVNKKNYCGYACMAKGKILAAPRTNKWENVRTWFSRFGRMSKCEDCGYDTEPQILVVHHKDRDRNNNDLSNLKVLCPNCHALEHLAERKSGWKGHISANPVKLKARQKVLERKTNGA